MSKCLCDMNEASCKTVCSSACPCGRAKQVPPSWDQKFLRLALEIASWSKDESTKVGCVIVGPDREIRSTGYNGLPRGVWDDVPVRNERPEKYFWFEHGERNAIFNAARMGTPLAGCTLYVASTPGKLGVCADCARAIIQSGITRVVHEEPDGDVQKWAESARRSLEMFEEAGVTYHPTVKL